MKPATASKEAVSFRGRCIVYHLPRLKDKQQTLSGTSDKNTDVKRSKPEL